MEMISEKTISVALLSGHCMAMEANVPMMVPGAFKVAAVLAGAMPYTGQPLAPVADPIEVDYAAEAHARSTLLQNTIRELISRGNEADFKTDGYPRVDAVRDISKLDDVAADEIGAAFILVKAED